jgi:glycerol-3-phosphate acyltransferase PlsY
MLWIIVLFGYLLGSFPTAYIASRLTQNKDIRRLGDNNMGAANAFREIGPAAGIAVGLIDAAKGALVIFITRDLGQPQSVVLAAGAAAVIGHNFPVFLGFRGGRGESTAIGEFVVLMPTPILAAAVPAIVTLVFSRNVILASAVLFIPMVALSWWMGFPAEMIGYSVAVLLLVAFTHFMRVRLTPVHVTVKSDKTEK